VRVNFSGQAVIVTGAGNGLGRAHALELARLGAHVVVNDLGAGTDGDGKSHRSADFVVREIRDAGGSAIASYDSVADDQGCRAIAAATHEAFGHIDAVVHNAGILRNAMFADMSDDRFFPVLETHLLGAFFLSRAVWPAMVERGYGRLVFTSSGSGVFGRSNGANYATAKAGIVGLCNALALEGEQHGVLVNAVMPVAFTRLGGAPDATDKTEEAKARRDTAALRNPRAQPEWVSPLVAYLASPACTSTHRYYSAVEGRFARVFVGVSAGWYAPEGERPTADDIAAHLTAIEDRADYDTPTSVFDEMELMRERYAPGPNS
jgi:NAD(P)-dependent dehydrogenase (short-subunit alcohol dehydrogenase family)